VLTGFNPIGGSMILYKYVSSKGEDIIRNLRIKVSSPVDFNDPFEFLASIRDITPGQVDSCMINNEKYLRHLHKLATSEGMTNKSFESFCEGIRSPTGRAVFAKKVSETLSEALRDVEIKSRNTASDIALLACFCRETREHLYEILMWSHYTDGHRGLRIAFNKDLLEIQGTKFSEIKYSPNRLQLNPLEYLDIQERDNKLKDFNSEAISTKSSAWSYENEYRWWVFPKQCHREGKDFFIRIKPEAIVEIVCGVKCSPEQVSTIKNLVNKNLGRGDIVKKAEIDNYDLKLNYVEC